MRILILAALFSVRIRYGMLGVDITNRMRGAVDINVEGIAVSAAALSAGRHRILIEFSEARGRSATLRLRVAVATPVSA